MNVKILILIQTVLTLLITSSLYAILLKLNKLVDDRETHISNYNEEEVKVGAIDDHYIVVLNDNATFIDGN